MKASWIGELTAATALGGWFLLSALHQMKRFRPFTSRFDRHGAWIPLWTFFGPIPGTLDAELMARYTESTGPSSWRHIAMYEPRKWAHMLYHPNRRLEKVMLDAISDIKRQLGEHDSPEKVTGSFAYAVLLNIVTAQARQAGSTHVQFMVVHSSGSDENPHSLVPLFASAVHPL